MKMEVSNLIEQEDGSAICNLDLDEEAKVFLINQAFVNILKIGLKEFELEFRDKDDVVITPSET